MATASIISTPGTFSSVYNPIPFILSSADITECEFKYIVDIYVDGTQEARLRCQPDSDGYGVIDIHRVLENYCSGDKPNNLKGFRESSNELIKYEVKVGVEYIDDPNCNGPVEIFPDLTTSGDLYALNSALQYDEWNNFDWSEYDLNQSNGNNKFLTNHPEELFIRMGEESYLSFINGTSSAVDGLYIKTYNSSNSNIGQFYIPHGLTATDNKIWTVGVGPENINYSNYSIVSGSTYSRPVNLNVEYYDVYLCSYTPPVFPIPAIYLRLSEIKRFKVDRNVYRAEGIRFTFLNRLGGWDSYTFNMKDTKSLAIKRGNYDKYIGGRQNTSWGWNIGDRGTTNISTLVEQNVKVVSNWMKPNVAAWLEELYTSPDVYKQLYNDTFECFWDNDFFAGQVGYKFYKETEFEVGDVILIDQSDITEVPEHNGQKTILSLENNGYAIKTDEIWGSASSVIGGEISLYAPQINFDPINITDNAWTYKDGFNKKLIQYDITFSYSYNKIIQRG